MEERKTSNEWWHDDPLFPKMRIADPDGWDRTKLKYSFYEEMVTKQEFEDRLMKSTLVPRDEKAG